MAQAPVRNFEFEQGVDDGFFFIVKDSAGSPIDLTTEMAEVRMRVKTNHTYGGITILSFSSTGTPNANIDIEPGAITGKVQVNILASDTIALSLPDETNAYVYDLEIIFTTLGIKRGYKGSFTVFKEITTPDSDFTP